MILPAPSDCGLALGAAMIADWLDGRPIKPQSPYLTRLSPEEVGGCGPPCPTQPTAAIAKRIAAGDIVAAILGSSETGPRALGHRSLLARPDSVRLRRRLSEGMKQREWYRPVAPMLLPHVAAECLRNFQPGSNLARYMLGAWTVKPEWRERLAGCVHADKTVRAQVIDPDSPEQQALGELLHILLDQHGIHGVINTSLNLRGCPIPHDPSVALAQAEALGVDTVWTTGKAPQRAPLGFGAGRKLP